MPAPAPSYGPTPDAAGMADAVFATGPAAPASGIPELLPLPPMPEEIQAPAQPYPMTWGAALSALPQATAARIAPGAAGVPPMDTTGMTLQQINALRNQAVMRILGLAPGAANPGDGGGGGFF